MNGHTPHLMRLTRPEMCHAHAAMPFVPGENVTGLLVRARAALGLTQKEFGTKFGVSHRTAGRWESRQSQPTLEEVHAIARAVHPKDPALAAALAAEGGTSLEGLKLVRPAPPATGAPPPTPARPFPSIGLMTDSIVLAAMEAAGTQVPAALDLSFFRRVSAAAFHRARGLGLTVDEVDDALSKTAPPAVRAASASARRSR
jgi:transcriptional regulator with XRE-family HTH domain